MGRPKFKSWHPITVTGLTDLRLIAEVRFVFSAKIRFSGDVGKSMPKISEFSQVNYCKFLVTLKSRYGYSRLECFANHFIHHKDVYENEVYS